MQVALNEDQRAIRDALDALARPFEEAPMHEAPLVPASPDFARALAESGFLDVACDPDLGTATAGVVVERLARLPFAVEAATRAFFAPLLEGVSGPVCLVEGTRTPRLVRFLEPGACVIVVEEQGVSCFTAGEGQLQPEPDSLFAYPMASLLEIPEDRTALPITPSEARTRARAALAAEAAGLMAAALASVCAHLSERTQFGRKLATFQALRHRLAEAQVRTSGVYWMAMKAAATRDPADAALAAWHAQESATSTVYDFHQFLGAMGMTLEHPLHFWTYRLKALIGELGGRGASAAAAADALWG
ncbi:acyl-CoA dehydrogenase family protein [Novosphingobium sp. MBES04]|uniref:acyl-CoA dehydrogenase family protein n=1 Tax=Novosphingobium sp. MBES04 TaxID=1206458 RepID=UPI00057E567F|nr:acyl-CoA dehydrogenase family protein [Novosphingobium sp. MBES04]GAM04291.1 acyl-CoA dehydrogenase [Novosphingobium sp. MBES04]